MRATLVLLVVLLACGCAAAPNQHKPRMHYTSSADSIDVARTALLYKTAQKSYSSHEAVVVLSSVVTAAGGLGWYDAHDRELRRRQQAPWAMLTVGGLVAIWVAHL